MNNQSGIDFTPPRITNKYFSINNVFQEPTPTIPIAIQPHLPTTSIPPIIPPTPPSPPPPPPISSKHYPPHHLIPNIHQSNNSSYYRKLMELSQLQQLQDFHPLVWFQPPQHPSSPHQYPQHSMYNNWSLASLQTLSPPPLSQMRLLDKEYDKINSTLVKIPDSISPYRPSYINQQTLQPQPQSHTPTPTPTHHTPDPHPHPYPYPHQHPHPKTPPQPTHILFPLPTPTPAKQPISTFDNMMLPYLDEMLGDINNVHEDEMQLQNEDNNYLNYNPTYNYPTSFIYDDHKENKHKSKNYSSKNFIMNNNNDKVKSKKSLISSSSSSSSSSSHHPYISDFRSHTSPTRISNPNHLAPSNIYYNHPTTPTHTSPQDTSYPHHFTPQDTYPIISPSRSPSYHSMRHLIISNSSFPPPPPSTRSRQHQQPSHSYISPPSPPPHSLSPPPPPPPSHKQHKNTKKKSRSIPPPPLPPSSLSPRTPLSQSPPSPRTPPSPIISFSRSPSIARSAYLASSSPPPPPHPPSPSPPPRRKPSLHTTLPITALSIKPSPHLKRRRHKKIKHPPTPTYIPLTPPLTLSLPHSSPPKRHRQPPLAFWKNEKYEYDWDMNMIGKQVLLKVNDSRHDNISKGKVRMMNGLEGEGRIKKDSKHKKNITPHPLTLPTTPIPPKHFNLSSLIIKFHSIPWDTQTCLDPSPTLLHLKSLTPTPTPTYPHPLPSLSASFYLSPLQSKPTEIISADKDDSSSSPMLLILSKGVDVEVVLNGAMIGKVIKGRGVKRGVVDAPFYLYLKPGDSYSLFNHSIVEKSYFFLMVHLNKL